MKDLDFDELDRAVNSVITNQPVQNNSDNTNPPVQPSDVVSPTLPIAPIRPAVERPSTGRFMDVVHPSSDMRTTLVMPERTSSKSTAAPTAQPPMVIPPAPGADKDEDADIDQISNDINQSLGQTSDNSQDSPFLPGTKVEKRPLGAFSTEQDTDMPAKPLMPAIGFSQNKEEKLAEINTPLPAELQSDLLSIEANETIQPEAPTDGSDDPEVAIIPPNTTPQPTSEVPVTASVSASTPVPNLISSTTSIPQQYTEQPSTGDKASGAIYDTNAYHTAMVTPAKKKSGWMWVVWIAVLMIASVGAGVAVYFLVLPRL